LHPVRLDQSTLNGAYQTAIGVTAGLFGFALATVSILRTRDGGRRLQALRDSHGPAVTRNLMAGIRALGLATLALFLAFVLDQPLGHRTIARALAAAALSLAVVRLVRLLWLVGLVLDLSDRDLEETGRYESGPEKP